jgi:hypothetical protein
MSAALDDGGPAFPQFIAVGDRAKAEGGASLLDLFAAFAMHSELMTCGVPGEAADALKAACAELGQEPIDRIAENAYAAAAAMLRAKQKWSAA